MSGKPGGGSSPLIRIAGESGLSWAALGAPARGCAKVCQPGAVVEVHSRTASRPHPRASRSVGRLLSETDRAIREDPTASRVAILSGVIFVFAGLVKFVFHHWELHAFREFGLPWPSALEIFAGVLEICAGALLVARRLLLPSALLLAATMIVAIGASGIGHGDIIPSLTLAPVLLIALLFLLLRTR